MAKEWTEFQQKAIETNANDICVAAGAGSGKTGVLVERFVRLVTESKRALLPPECRANVDEILVITFTEKATKEMKARIVEELNRLGMIAERRQVETAYISTIHGFCSRLLQENPFEAGVDPQFGVLDEMQARRLRHQAFEAVIAGAYEAGDTEITELVATAQSARQYGDSSGDPLSGLEGAVESTLAKLRGAGKSRVDVERHWALGLDGTAAQSLDPVRALLDPLLSEIAACIEGVRSLRSSALGVLDIACKSMLDCAPRLRPDSTDLCDTIAAMETAMQTASRARPRFAHATQNELELGHLFERIKSACKEAETLFHVTASREAEVGLLCHRLWGLVVAVWKAYDQAKRAAGKLDTDDLQAEGVRLLEESPSVRARYQRRFRYLMVDEFQDTNPLQMRLIELLHVPARRSARQSERTDAATPKTNFLFIVGDVQQSIYGFRHADASLFRELERRYREEDAGIHIPLAVNFRSRPEILAVVRHVFQQVWRAETTPFTPLTPGAGFDPKPTPSLEILVTQDLSRRDYVRVEAEALAARIQQMVEGREWRLTSHLDRRRGEPVGYRDIAVLLRGLTDIEKYEQAFAQRGVPYFVVGGGRGYYARHEIRDLLNILTALDTPLDDVALAAALRSPLVGADTDTLYRLAKRAGQTDTEANTPESAHSGRQMSQRMPLYGALDGLIESGELPEEEAAKLRLFQEVIEGLRAQEDRLPVGHLLERLIARAHYDARLLCRPGGRRRLANVRKLLQIANSDSVTGVRDFIRRLHDLKALSDREGDAPTEEEAADVVRFLTIHGAKGLEFPVVVLADLSRGLLIPERGLFACDPQALALGSRLGGEPNLVYKAIDKQRQAADRKESERLLYVAMTRAREHLVLCGNIGRNYGLNWADDLFPALGVLTAPPELQTQIISGGIVAQVAPLAGYLHAPIGDEGETALSRRQAEARADRIANAILRGEPFENV